MQHVRLSMTNWLYDLYFIFYFNSRSELGMLAAMARGCIVLISSYIHSYTDILMLIINFIIKVQDWNDVIIHITVRLLYDYRFLVYLHWSQLTKSFICVFLVGCSNISYLNSVFGYIDMYIWFFSHSLILFFSFLFSQNIYCLNFDVLA